MLISEALEVTEMLFMMIQVALSEVQQISFNVEIIQLSVYRVIGAGFKMNHLVKRIPYSEH